MPEYATYPGRRGPKVGTMRVGMGGGEIVQVQGGHIIRATGRKDRHSKVYTAKGPRDRRVRLSAHTAIQFYDVQDRLGYDRPSKAVDWLIKKAKDAIDKLDQLPPFDPTQNNNNNNPAAADSSAAPGDLNPNDTAAATDLGMVGGEGNNNNSESSGYEIQQQIHGHHHQNQIGGGDNNMSAAALSLDSNSMVAETMRSFFPTTTTTAGLGEQMNSMGGFQSYPQHQQQHNHNHNHNHGQDLLGLSLHTFHDSEAAAHAAFPAGFVATGGSSTPTGWAAENQPEMGRFSRLLAWSGGGGGGFGAAQGGNNSFLFGERGTFQTSLINHQQPSSIRAWDDLPHHQPSISGMIGGSDGFMAGFCIPTVHHQHQDGINNKSSSMSTDSSN